MSELKAEYRAGKAQEWEPVTVALRDLTPWERNPKTISKSHAKRLLALWKDLGQFQTIAIGPGGEVYDGHQRLNVLKAAFGDGYEVQALRSPVALTDEQREELTIAAHVGTVGQFSWDELANWDVGKLQEWGLDGETLRSWKSDAGALTNMLEAAKPHAGAEPQIDRAEELRKKWGVETGDLWRIGEHRLLCGDSTKREAVERVMGGEKAAMIFTDAPYNTCNTWSGLQEYRGHEQVENDNREDWQAWAAGCFALWLDVALDKDLAGYWWFGQRESPREFLKKAGMYIRGHVVWVKEHYNVGRADYHSQYEECQYFSNGERHYKGARNQSDVRTANRVEEERLHPTQKPVSLFSGLIEQHDIDLIFDPFCGSGTTLVACQNLARKCRAIEISPGYVAVALERMATAFPGIEIERL